MPHAHTRSPLRSSRRRLLSGISLLSASLIIAGCAADDPGAEPDDDATASISGQIVWADYGGPTNESRQIAFFESFEDETGVSVISDSISDAIKNAMLGGENGDYDIFQATVPDVVNNAENLIELPEDARSDLLPEELQPYGIAGFYLAFAQGWLTDTFPDGGPQNWVDFFDVETYPGLRAWPGSPGSFDVSFEVALLADGVAPEDLYPLDFERAYAKMDELRPHMTFYTAYPEVQQLLTSGSASLAVTVTGQYAALANAGEDVTIQWNQAVIAPNLFVIPAEASNPEAAFELARWIKDGEREAEFAERTLYGPVNSTTFDYISDEVLPDLANSPENTENVIVRDDTFRASVWDQLLSSYGDWLSQ